MITEEVKEKNYSLYIKKLNQIGIDTSILEEKYGEVIKNAPFTTINDYGNSYDGSLLEIVLKILTPYAIKINESLPKELMVDKNVLIKICLLHQIAKGDRVKPNDNSWEITNRKILYKWKESAPSIGSGLHSLAMCTECGIAFTKEEIEALTINDRELTEPKTRYHSSVLSNIIRIANELTYIQINGHGKNS